MYSSVQSLSPVQRFATPWAAAHQASLSIINSQSPRYWSFSFSINPFNEFSGLISFRMDWLDLLAVQGTLKSLLQHLSSKASILQCSAFFIVQLSHLWTWPLATWCAELTHWKRPWCWERLKEGGEGDDREWDGWMASLAQWTWVRASSRSWWCTRQPGVLQSMGSQRVKHNWAAELNWNASKEFICCKSQ